MYLRIGSKIRPFNEARASIAYQVAYDGFNRASTVKVTWGISGRVIQQSNATATGMSQKIAILKQDFSQFRPDLHFYEDDGITPTELRLLASELLDGPNLLDLSFPDKEPDVYTTGVEYGATFEGTGRAVGATANPISEFQETITPGDDGGLILGYVGGALNPPELQVFKQAEAWSYTQSGSAVGLYGYPDPPPPLWPQFQMRTMQPIKESPRVAGPIPMYFRISWSYRFASPFQLSGNPHTFTN